MAQPTNLTIQLRDALLRSGWVERGDAVVQSLDADHELAVLFRADHLGEPDRLFEDHMPTIGLTHHGVAGVMADLVGASDTPTEPTIVTAIGLVSTRRGVRYSDHEESDSFEHLWADFEAARDFISGFRGQDGLIEALTDQRSFFNSRDSAWRTQLAIEVFFGWTADSEELLDAVRRREFEPEPVHEFETALRRKLGHPDPSQPARLDGWVFECRDIGLDVANPTTEQIRSLLAPAAHSDSQSRVFTMSPAGDGGGQLSCLCEDGTYQLSFAEGGDSEMWIGPALDLDEAVWVHEQLAVGGRSAAFSRHEWEKPSGVHRSDPVGSGEPPPRKKRRWFR